MKLAVGTNTRQPTFPIHFTVKSRSHNNPELSRTVPTRIEEIMSAAPKNISFIGIKSLDPGDHEVLTRMVEYARAEADRLGEPLCAELLSAALLSLNGGSAQVMPEYDHDSDGLRWPHEVRHFVA
ncbi:hypothetical protein L1787_18710 [Acuticoccus sp. M5D2P5]|uniref:hypothetical protein n=1 Tax=Acuticoccus kalidii TaxID=2910977 RepID=UPI001F2B1604|nr:hypothetical protein [Acuticoccus kalidii]MCF3935426.1 hypothetical protein [Acuticoccus kalidii]